MKTLPQLLLIGFTAVISLTFTAHAQRVPPFTIESQEIFNDLNGRVPGLVALVSDAGASGSQAVRYTGTGRVTLENYNRDCPAPGAYRVTVRMRVETAVGVVVQVRGWSSSGSPYFYYSRGSVDFRDATAASGYLTRSVDLLVPASDGGWGFAAELPAGIVIDWIKVDPAPAGSHPVVDLLGVRAERLFYPLGTAAHARVPLLNTAATSQSVRLRLRVESGLAASTTVSDGPVTVPPTGRPHAVSIPIGWLVEGGSTVIAEVLDAGGAVLGEARDVVLSAANRADVSPLYGIYTLNDSPPYTSGQASHVMRGLRETFAALAEIAFGAACETTMLTSPPGRSTWWSGQTLMRVGRQQLLDYKGAADAHGIGLVSYANYSDTYGWRVLEAGRAQPEILEWDASNKHVPNFAFDMASAAAPDSRQRREDESEWSFTSPNGKTQVLMSHPAMLRLHGDQLAASMQEFGWIGYRYDDPPDYDSAQFDLFGRRAPYDGWSNANMIRYLRERIAAQRPDAVYGRNMDGMRVGWGGYNDSGGTTTQVDTEAAILRGGGGFLLQEAWSNEIFARGHAWTDVRARFLAGGRNAHAGGGRIFAIVDMSGAPNDAEREYIAAIAGASRVQLAYQAASPDPMRFLARHSALLFGKNVAPVADAASLVSVNVAGAPVWWQDSVFCRYAAPGQRQYVVHLINPPANANANSANPVDPAPLANVAVTFTPPVDWNIVGATVLTPDQTELARTFTEKLPDQPYSPHEFGNLLAKQPASQPLSVVAGAVVVPQLVKWSVVVFDCTGPASDLPDGPPAVLPPLPAIPDLNQPETAPPLTREDFALTLQASSTWPNTSGTATTLLTDTTARGGTALRVTSQIVDYERVEIGNVHPGDLGAAGLYQFTVRIRTESPTVRNLTMLMRNAGNEPVPYSVSAPFHTTALTPADGWREYTCTLQLGEAVSSDLGVQMHNLWPGLVIDDLKVTRLALATDAARLTLSGQTPWPANPGPFIPQAAPRVWFGDGLFSHLFRLREAIIGTAPGATFEFGHPYLYGFDNRGWNGTPFPQTPAVLLQKDLIVLANIPANNNAWPNNGNFEWLDWLRGYVNAGGRLVLAGGPYGFARGGWQSDLLAGMLPVTLAPRTDSGIGYDLKKATGGSAELVPVSPLAQSLDWSEAPVTMWMHETTPKPGATVHVIADGKPLVVTGSYGAGRVAVILAAPLGDAPAGQTAFWDSPQWPALMSGVVSHLMSNEVRNCAPPQFSPAPGGFFSALTVSLSSATPEAIIRYTVDGTDPTPTSGMLYQGPFGIPVDTEVRAIATREGFIDSGVVTARYEIGPRDSHWTLFGSAPAGGGSDNDSDYELGTKFRSTKAGHITALRVWRPSTGGRSTYTARLWTNAGALLSSVTFPAPVAGAWAEGPLVTAVPIAAGSTYVVSYSVNAGDRYQAHAGHLAQSRGNGPLLTLTGENNGVYANTTGTFPTSAFQSSCYYADVRFRDPDGAAVIELWRHQYFATTENTGPAADLADPDFDGVANLLEYALGLDPWVPLTSGDMLKLMRSGAHSALSFTRLRDATDITYRLERSPDLAPLSWQEIWNSTGDTYPGAAPSITETMSIDESLLDRAFYRLRITRP